jgi:hypothetical protein
MRRVLHIALLLFFTGLFAHAGIASYTDRGKIDFDTAMQLLNPYGTWSQIKGAWAYIPLDHQAPYTRGRWLYTEFGWYWKGDQPASWLTEHYGFWKRGDDKVWSWYPGDFWLPQIVEIRTSDGYVGWRCAEVDNDGNFVEAPADRYAKIDEWNFVSNRQFTGPVTPEVLAKPGLTSKLLDESNDSIHTYTTYRAIDRPGPHPTDFVALAGDGGMFAPKVENENMPAARPLMMTTKVSTAPTPAPKPAAGPKRAPSGAAAEMNTNAAPEAAGEDEKGPVDLRQVNYWITMSVPTYWTRRPSDAKPNEVYIYRPDFYQDQDGIERRIRLWLSPNGRALQKEELNTVLSAPSKHSSAPSAPGLPAVPVAPSGNPFRSPFEETFPDGSKASSRAASPATNAVPAGTH